MQRTSRISLDIDGNRFVADLHEEKAPKTIAALRSILPYNAQVIHARYSGEAIWIPLPENLLNGIPLENQTSYPSRGELLFYPGFISEKEILIPYGSALFSSRVGLLPGNHFATIGTNLDKLQSVGIKVLWEGAKDISISKKR